MLRAAPDNYDNGTKPPAQQGMIIYNTDKKCLEFFNGEEFEVLSSQPIGSFEATASLGEVSVSEEGSISINVSI